MSIEPAPLNPLRFRVNDDPSLGARAGKTGTVVSKKVCAKRTYYRIEFGDEKDIRRASYSDLEGEEVTE